MSWLHGGNMGHAADPWGQAQSWGGVWWERTSLQPVAEVRVCRVPSYTQHSVWRSLSTGKLLRHHLGVLFTSHCLQVWLKQPLVSLTDIQERHNIVDALVEDPLLRERLRNLHLRGAGALEAFPSVPCPFLYAPMASLVMEIMLANPSSGPST